MSTLTSFFAWILGPTKLVAEELHEDNIWNDERNNNKFNSEACSIKTIQPRGRFHWHFIFAMVANWTIIFTNIRDHFKTHPAVDRPFWAVAIVLNNGNRPEPAVLGGQPPVEFWSDPLVIAPTKCNTKLPFSMTKLVTIRVNRIGYKNPSLNYNRFSG